MSTTYYIILPSCAVGWLFCTMAVVQPPADERRDPTSSVKPCTPLRRREALTLFPIGFTIWKDFGGGFRQQGQVYDYRDRCWRVSALQPPQQGRAHPLRDEAVAELRRQFTCDVEAKIFSSVLVSRFNKEGEGRSSYPV